MMTSSKGNIFRVIGPLCGEFTVSAGNSPHKCQWRGPLMFSLICAGINGWVNNREAGDLRRHRAHYDVTVMWDEYAIIRLPLEQSWHHLPVDTWNESSGESTHWPLGDFIIIFKLIYWLMAEVFLVKLPWVDCHPTSLIVSQHWFR